MIPRLISLDPLILEDRRLKVLYDCVMGVQLNLTEVSCGFMFVVFVALLLLLAENL